MKNDVSETVEVPIKFLRDTKETVRKATDIIKYIYKMYPEVLEEASYYTNNNKILEDTIHETNRE